MPGLAGHSVPELAPGPMVFDPHAAQARGLEVLRLEAAAIQSLAGRLQGSFLEACRRILSCKGRVVVTGMGKAGLIGQKISATLASTGTPSLSLHPADALHGDLGRVVRADVVLALSNSGKTRELLALIPAVKAMGACVIAITADAGSPLGRSADVVVELGRLDEACPLGLAPTVTTTAMLALGDALAMAVAEGREFTREEFAQFHPAGDLGRELMRVGEIMRRGRELPLLPGGARVRDALGVMTETPGRPGAALVVDQKQRLLGIFTDGDLRRMLQRGPEALSDPIEEHMVRNPRVLRRGMLVGAALALFKDAHVDQMPVVDDDGGTVLGLVDVQDLLEVRL
ncbi:MAG: KpsF/GutQ family sugar-phosphate isomerase [Planctomycetota bacterium]|nr:MAG: KpsF/GutQ family sugar-phosphate isomerase [Planctomycetota bacterium]